MPSGITPWPCVSRIGRVERDHVISLLQRGHAGTGVDNYARAFMAKNCREKPLWIGARERKLICVTDAGGLDFDQNLSFLGAVQLHVNDFKRFACLKGDSGAHVHDWFSPCDLKVLSIACLQSR